MLPSRLPGCAAQIRSAKIVVKKNQRKPTKSIGSNRAAAKNRLHAGKLEADILIVDESTKFKNQRSQRFKLLKPFLPKFSRRWIMTGTPTPNGFLDLFAQAYLVDLGRALGEYITYYRQRYFFQSGYMGYDWKLKPGADKEIMKACKPFAISLKAEDYLELPPLVNNIVRVTLPGPARKAYDSMEEQLFAELENGEEVTALSASGAAGRCCQIANGGVYREELKNGKVERITEQIHDAKTEALEDSHPVRSSLRTSTNTM